MGHQCELHFGPWRLRDWPKRGSPHLDAPGINPHGRSTLLGFILIAASPGKGKPDSRGVFSTSARMPWRQT
jgi:hypothetical protein